MRLPAEVVDAYALDVNPAGLGFLEGTELRLRYARQGLRSPAPTRGPRDGLGLYLATQVFGRLSFGTAVDVDVDAEDRTGTRLAFGTAYRFDSGALGISVDRLRAPGAQEAKTRVNAGLTHHINSGISVALSVFDLAQSVRRRQWDLGLALRPWQRLVISGRWRIVQDQTVFAQDTLDLAGLVSLEALDGVRLGVGVQHNPILDLAVTAQLELNFGQFSVGTAALAVNEDFSMVADVSVHSRPEPGLGTSTGIAIVDIGGALRPKDSLNIVSQSSDVAPYGDLPLLLEALASSDRVYGVFARIGPISAGWAKIEEVREGLRRIRASGRRVDCQLSAFEDNAYLVATGCDSIILPPPSVLRIDGVAATSLFFGDLLTRAGISPQVIRRGRYKSAPEQLTRSGMSPAQREAMGAYLDQIYETLAQGIVQGRGLKPKRVRTLLDLGTHTASQALARGLVDHLLYPDEIEAHLHKEYGHRVGFLKAEDAVQPTLRLWAARPKVALLYVDAAIVGGDSEDLPLGIGRSSGARTLIRALDALRIDPDVKAVVLRVDSPGGDSLASDLVARAVKRLDEVKPVIASFGDVAASGGYYVAAPARLIYAQPTTLTGSIGVFSMAFSIEGLLGRLGVGVQQLQRGANSGAGTPFVGWTASEKAKTDEVVDHFYERFLNVVAQGRDMPRDAVHAVAQGRIWSGKAAKAQGLVDELGGFVAAIHRAKKEAGLHPDEAVDLWVYPDNRSGLPRELRSFSQALGLGSPAASTMAGWLEGLLPSGLRTMLMPWLVPGARPEAMAMLPFVLEFDAR